MSQQYISAAKVLSNILNKRGSLRAVYKNGDTNARKTQAIVAQTIRYRHIIEELVNESSLRKRLTETTPTDDERKRNCVWRYLAFVLIYELLFGRGKIQGGGYVQRTISSCRDEFDKLLRKLKAKHNVDDVTALLRDSTQIVLGRFARVNTLKITVKSALQELSERGFALDDVANVDEPVQEGFVRVDALIPYVLEFAPGTDLHEDPFVQNGSLVLQDKASCMPAHCLSPPPAAVCVDACAAPGNKTTQLAALIGSSSSSSSTSTKRGTILAVDRDRVRLATLQRAATQTDAAPLVVPHCDDFLRLTERVALFGGDSTTTKGGNSTRRLLANNSNNNRSSSNSNNKNNNKHNNKNSNDDGAIDALLRRATHALCDPSCSVATLVDGSGIVSRDATLGLDADADRSTDVARLRNLAKFQRDIVIRAMMLPAMQRVVYSTCSIHEIENEDVVRAVLSDHRVKARHWRQIPALPDWPRRGVRRNATNDNDDDNDNNNDNDDDELASMCARTDAYFDRTSGFFVALFERDDDVDDDVVDNHRHSTNNRVVVGDDHNTTPHNVAITTTTAAAATAATTTITTVAQPQQTAKRARQRRRENKRRSMLAATATADVDNDNDNARSNRAQRQQQQQAIVATSRKRKTRDNDNDNDNDDNDDNDNDEAQRQRQRCVPTPTQLASNRQKKRHVKIFSTKLLFCV